MKIFVKVKANAKKQEIKPVDAAHFEIKVKAAPKKGRANSAVIETLADYLGISKSRIKIISGEKSKQKILEIK